jgi:hypothetical protein
MFEPRYMPGRYRDCKWCGGRGCVACDSEAEKDYKKEFPNGPELIASFRTDTPDGVLAAKKFLDSVFGEKVSEAVLTTCRQVNEEHNGGKATAAAGLPSLIE